MFEIYVNFDLETCVNFECNFEINTIYENKFVLIMSTNLKSVLIFNFTLFLVKMLELVLIVTLSIKLLIWIFKLKFNVNH